MKELVEYVCAATGRRRIIVGLSDRLSYLQARLMEWTPGPLMTRDNYYSMQVPNVCSGSFPVRHPAAGARGGRARPTSRPSGPRERYPQLRWRARR